MGWHMVLPVYENALLISGIGMHDSQV